ncbi:hypothetical protein AWC38_SpisGene17578 [Stylophora pistillata]|uniref:Uncharacterized protein n=1 Tax=Stylophora pistillata TaxID=50429 RepID=A0A2B4RNH3_STYPI|nr:hypothetical protein AWC38_SpisGene17578 [Stylophora pistillata]
MLEFQPCINATKADRSSHTLSSIGTDVFHMWATWDPTYTSGIPGGRKDPCQDDLNLQMASLLFLLKSLVGGGFLGRTTTIASANLGCSSSFAPDPLIKLPLVDPSAREHEGAIPKTKHWQPDLQSTVKPDVKEKMWMGTFGSQSHLNLPSIPWREFSDECAQSSLHPPESSERAVGNADGCQRGNESQDTGFFSGEGNSYTQMSSLSTNPEHIGKTEHHSQVLKSVSARPTTPEGATTDRNSPSLATGCHYNRPINLNDPVEVDFVPENETGRPVEHYDARENNGLCEEELESSTKDNLFLTRKLREMESVCNTLRENLFQCRQTFRESRPPCAYLQAENDRLQVENEEESRLMRLSLAIRSRLETRRADDVASEGSSAAVEEDNASDNSIVRAILKRSEEVELDVDEQPGPFPQESDSEDSDNDEFYEARDDLFL